MLAAPPVAESSTQAFALEISLSALEAYATDLYTLLGGVEATSQALVLLLNCCGGCQAKSWTVELTEAGAGAQPTNPGDLPDGSGQRSVWEGSDRLDTVLSWCFSGQGLLGSAPEAAVRALLLKSVVVDNAHSPALGRVAGPLLQAAPQAIASATAPAAANLAEAVCGVFKGAAAAAAWLETLRASWEEDGPLSRADAAQAYTQIASTMLTRYTPADEVVLEAWTFAPCLMRGSDTSQRKVCMQLLLPPLAAATENEEAAARLAGFVTQLFAGASRAEVADALHLAVEFRDLLIPFWGLASWSGLFDEAALELLATCLRSGLKEYHALRKEARFVVQQAVHLGLSSATEAQIEHTARSTAKNVSLAWRSYWELFDSIEDYSSHLLKSSWDQLIAKLTSFLEGLPVRVVDSEMEAASRTPSLPPIVFSPFWLEVFFSRAFGHDNDSVQRFVLGEVLKLDPRAVRLSAAFVLEELLPRFSHSIDTLYPRSDVNRTFERQVIRFFSGFVQRHECGASWAAKQLLSAVLRLRTVHHTPLRLVLLALREVEEPGTLAAADALELTEVFFREVLTRMPQSVRRLLTQTFLELVTRSMRRPPEAEVPGLSGSLARALALVPDHLLDTLHEQLGALVSAALGKGTGPLLIFSDLLKALAASHPASCPALPSPVGLEPMPAAMMTFGALRGLWAYSCSHEAEELSNASSKASTTANAWAEANTGTNSNVSSSTGTNPTVEGFASCVWPALAPVLSDFHLRMYLPQRVAVVVLIGCVYSAALLPDACRALEGHHETRRGVLAFVESRASAALGRDTAAQEEACWVWLYALVLERFWSPGEPFGEAIAERSLEVLQSSAGNEEADSEVVLAVVAAVSLLGALAPRMGTGKRRAEISVALWRARLPKLRGISDTRFLVSSAEGQGVWARNRLEEFEDLHRAEREGLGRVLEWRDTTAVFLLAKWRALAKLSITPDFLENLEQLAEDQATTANTWLQDLACGILAELEALQPPHVAFWAVVARRVAFPLVFNSGTPVARQLEVLEALCSGLRGAIQEGTGDGSAYMPRGCMAEIAATLCDPQLCKAEQALVKDSKARPLGRSVQLLLAQGEISVGISRCVAVPLLASLLKPWDETSACAPPDFAGLLVTLLFHSEGTIVDGALCHSPDPAAGVVDEDGPGGERALASVCSTGPGELTRKFGHSRGLPRILTLAALDGLADRSGRFMPELIISILELVFAELEGTLMQLLKPAAKPCPTRPPTPMPTSARHRTQLRGWQAALVLGARADRRVASIILPKLFFHLAVPHVPDVRDYQEILGCILCARFHDLAVMPLLIPALQQFDSNVQVCASLLVISGYLLRHWVNSVNTGDQTEEGVHHSAALLRAIAPYLGHNAAYVRGMAAWCFFEIFHSLNEEHAVALGVDEPIFRECYRFLVENRECQKMRGRLKPVFEDFDPASRSALPCFLERVTVRPDPTGELTLDDALHVYTDSELHPTQTFLDLLKDEVASEVANLWDRGDPTQYLSSSESWHELLLQAARAQRSGVERPHSPKAQSGNARVDSAGLDAAGGASGLQRKFCPDAPPAHSGPRAESRRKVAPLQVVATLVDKVQNLGGLCRTCEVFACEALSIANAKMAKDQTFQSISVTAEKWLPISEVPRAGMRDHLLDLRQRGYALVGVEQTHTSVPLDKWTFAPRTALVLGAEKEGIDGDLLPLLDGCVEIPQFGQLRSLNVHVSASLVIWEYTRQQRPSAL